METKERKNKKGISLIVLVITIIVIVILAVAVILTLSNNNPIENATNAVNANDKAVLEETINLAKTNLYAQNNGELPEDTIDKIRSELNNQGFTDEKLRDYFLTYKDEFLEKARILGQDVEVNQDIGIGTDGEVVNLDLWKYSSNNTDKSIILGSGSGSWGEPAYDNNNIVDGRIKGTVPQYIYINEYNDFFTTTTMNYTFESCENLVYAPKIPTTVKGSLYGVFNRCHNLKYASNIPYGVTSMSMTFYHCESLLKAPEIPSPVTDMGITFSSCSSLTGELVINANPTSFDYCLSGVATNPGTKLYLSGTSTMLNEILATKSSNSNIEIKQ